MKDKRKRDSWWVRILKGTLKTVIWTFVLIIAFGLFLLYFTPPTINVTDAKDKRVSTDNSTYMLKGYLNSGIKSQLKINGTTVELVGKDFTFDTILKKGDNRFVIEASNKRGVTEEIYIVHLTNDQK